MAPTTMAAIITSSKNVTINGGTFNQSNLLRGELDLEKITNSASPNAFYDSAANQLPTSTQNPDAEHYIRIALDWVQSQDSPILWIVGESRALTSLIATSTAETCSSDHHLLTTFFFSKADPKRNSSKHFIASLAYGIIQSIPVSRGAITQAIDDDPLMLDGYLEKQFNKLILDPLNHLYDYYNQQRAENDRSLPYLIIINALDECEDDSERRQISRLFERLYISPRQNGHHHRDRLPWKILITSKFDQTIADALPKSIVSIVSISETSGEYNLPAGRTRRAENFSSGHNSTLAPSITSDKFGSSKIPVQGSPGGLRLLSIDGGGIRGLSALITLEEITQRLKSSRNLQVPPKPCELFDLAGGTGTGGLIVILLFRFRMSVKEAIDAYVTLMKYVFNSGGKWCSQGIRTSRLEEGLLSLISTQLNISIEKARMERMIDETSPKCFVCATPSKSTPTQRKSEPIFFRTWARKSQESHRNVTTFEAARATLTLPNLFKSTEIAVGGVVETFVDAGYKCNNPTIHILDDAMATLTSLPSCVVSLGTGLEGIMEFQYGPGPDSFQRLLPTKLIQVFKTIAQDCEGTAKVLKQQMSGSMPSVFYFRFNVGRGMRGVSLEEWEKSLDVVRRTESHLRNREAGVNQLVNVLCTLTST